MALGEIKSLQIADGLVISAPAGAPLSASRLELVEAAAPATPPSGFLYLYTKTDGILYSKDDAGVERAYEASDADLTAIAALSGTGLIARTGAGTAATRSIAAGSSKITVSNPAGVAGDPTIDVVPGEILAQDLGGVLTLAKGGTGVNAASTTALFNAIDPLTTKGDILVNNGTNSVRRSVGLDGQVLTADSVDSTGLSWSSPLTNPMTGSGDLITGGVAGAATRLAHPGVNNRVVRSTSTTATGFGQIDDPAFFTTGAAAGASAIGIVTTSAQSFAGVKTFNDGIAVSSGGSTLSSYVAPTSWTPTLRGSGTAGTPTYTTQVGRYQRIGGVIYFMCKVVWTAISGSPTGNLIITGLPVTSVNTTGVDCALSVLYVNIDFQSTNLDTQLMAQVPQNSTTIEFYSSKDDAAATPILASTATTGTRQLFVTGMYFVA